MKRLSVHNKPPFLIITGLLFGMIAGSLLPVFGIFWAKLMMVMGNWDDAKYDCLYLIFFAPVSFVVIYAG